MYNLEECLVTICIPFYNDEKFLEKAILSVINQTYKRWNLVLLDDGSNDSSLDIAKKYLYDKRITLNSDGVNKGLIFRLNQSIRQTQTKYYARMDADDIMHPKRIELQLNILLNNPNIDVLGTNAYSIDSQDNIQGMRYEYNRIEKNQIKKVEAFIHPTIMGKTEWFKLNEYANYAFRMEDTELWYRTKNNSCFYIVLRPLLYYREFGGNYYKKYLNALRPHWSTFLVYSRQEEKISFFWLKNTLLMLLKGLIYMFFCVFSSESFLIKRRNLRVSKENSLLAAKDLSYTLKKQ